MHRAATINWSSLLDSKGRPYHDIHNTILQALTLFSEMKNVPKKPGGIFLLHQGRGTLTCSFSKANMCLTVSRIRKKLNGTAGEYHAVLVDLPSGKSFDRTVSALREIEQGHDRTIRLGKEAYDHLISQRRSRITIANVMTHVLFGKIASRDKEDVELHILRCGLEASGIYFIREHRPGRSFGEIVYVGMSVGRIGRTAKDHFRNWSGKNPGENETSFRGEDRGRWLEKIGKGYHYEIGTLTMEKPKGMESPIFRTNILKIEGLFIHALNPRDNAMKKQTPGTQEELFNTSAEQEEKTTALDDDDLPF